MAACAGANGLDGATGPQGPAVQWCHRATGNGITNIIDNGNGTITIVTSNGFTFTVQRG
ncbi:MAG: hypothetical protein U0V74_01695 [Chitinophagales bacterium]